MDKKKTQAPQFKQFCKIILYRIQFNKLDYSNLPDNCRPSQQQCILSVHNLHAIKKNIKSIGQEFNMNHNSKVTAATLTARLKSTKPLTGGHQTRR